MVDPSALRKCLRYMRLDDLDLTVEDREDVSDLYEAAQEYLADAGISVPADGEPDKLYLRTVHALTLYYYDHRDAIGSAPDALRPVINTLKGRASVARAAQGYTAE